MKIRFQRQARESPESIAGLAVPYAPAKRSAPKWRWYLILLTVASPVVVLMFGVLGGLITRSANGAVALDQLAIRAIAAGRIRSIAARIGGSVAAGDVVAVLDDPRQVADPGLAARAGSSAGARAQSAAATADAVAEFSVRVRAQRLAAGRRDRMSELVTDGAATRGELREAEAALDQADVALLQARRAAITTSSAQAAATAATRSRQGPLTSSAINRTPIAGRILDVFVSEGEIVAAGDPLLLVGRLTTPTVTAYVSPKFAASLHAGARATVRFADSSKANAEIAEAARITRRMPADLVDPFGMRPMMVVLRLQAATAWPPGQAIHGLPVRVRFHYGWEDSALGSVFSPLLDAMAGAP